MADLCGAVHPIWLDPSETIGIKTQHLSEMVQQNRVIVMACHY